MAPPNAKGKGRETEFRLWSPARYRHILAVRLAAVRVGRLGGQGSALQRSLVVKVVTIWSDLAKWMAIDQVSGPDRAKGHPRAQPMLVVFARRCSPSASTAGIERPRSFPLCCKRMFQLFWMFQRYATSVSYVCCKIRSRCCIFCNDYTRMLQAFVYTICI
jgi:hypothetical protein